MKNKLSIFLWCFCFTFAACNIEDTSQEGSVLYKDITETNFALTDEMVVKYIAVYKKMRAFGIDYVNTVNQSEGATNGMEGYSQIEQIITDGGFTDFAEFIRVNAKIAWAFSIVQGSSGMEDIKNMQDNLLEQGNEIQSEAIAEIDRNLNDPEVPEATKVELRKTKQELLQANQQMNQEVNQNWDKNKKWADITMNLVKKITSDEDMNVVKKHRKELLEVFVGIELPTPN